MLSTTITTLDASPRAMSKTIQLLFNQDKKNFYFYLFLFWQPEPVLFFFFTIRNGITSKNCNCVIIITAPFYAILNYKLVISKHMPKSHHPKIGMKLLSVLGISFLIGFTLIYLLSLQVNFVSLIF